jgi:NAD+ synthase
LQGIQKILTDFEASALLANANIRPRLRMTILYYYANLMNRLVVGCGNRSELRAGYFTKYGDGGADIFPLGCIYKTQVRQLAVHLGLSRHIIDKVPTAGLWRGQTDEGELGITYEKLDMIYAGLDLGLRQEVVASAAGVDVGKVKEFVERERRAAHKLRVPDIPKL